MALLTVRLASGRSIVIDSFVCPTVAGASKQICEELGGLDGGVMRGGPDIIDISPLKLVAILTQKFLRLTSWIFHGNEVSF